MIKRVLFFVSATAFIILMPLIIDGLFVLGGYFPLINTSFNRRDILTYIGAVMPLFSAAVFSWLVLKQNKQIHSENKKMQKQMKDLEAETLKNSYFNHMDIIDIDVNSKRGIKGIKIFALNRHILHQDIELCLNGEKKRHNS